MRIYGFHSVTAALKAPRRELVRLYATPAAAERLAAEIAARGVETRLASAEEIAQRLPRDAVHQGVLLEARPLAPIDISELPADGPRRRARPGHRSAQRRRDPAHLRPPSPSTRW